MGKEDMIQEALELFRINPESQNDLLILIEKLIEREKNRCYQCKIINALYREMVKKKESLK